MTFEDVAVGDTAGEPMMTVDRFEITIELMPLLQGQFRITSMRLDQPKMRVVVSDDGTLDWQRRNEASQALDPENVILDRLEIVDGRIAYTDRVGETDLTFEGVNAVIEARSLLGPWRVEGSYLEDGVAVPFRFATGRLLDDGTIRLKTDLSPAGWPVALAADGIVGNDEEGLYYDGTFNLTEVVASASPEEREEAGGDVAGWRSEGKFRLTRRQLAITQAVLSEGPPERPFSVAGSLTLHLGSEPHFEAHGSARQIDLDRSLGDGPAEPVEVSSAFNSLVAWLKDSFVPPIPGSIFFQVPGIVVGGSVIQNVAFEVRPTIGGWRITSLDADLPGRAALEARGVLATDFEVGFAGNLRLVVNQPALFAKWWRGESQGDAGRLLAPFEIAGRAELSPGHFVFEEIDAVFGGASVRGRFAWSEATARQHRRELETDLVADSIDFVQLRAFAELVGGNDLANTTVFADSYDIKLSADTFQFEDVAMHEVAIDAGYADDTLTVNQFGIGDLGGAHVNVTEGRIESLSERPRGHLDAQFEAESLDVFTRVVERVLPEHAFSRWLRKAGRSLSPAFLTASIEAPAREGDADIRANISGAAAATTLSASIDMTGSLADWRQGEAGVEIVVDSPSAAELARQAGLMVDDDAGAAGAHLEINAEGVPANGLQARVAGEFAGIGLRSEGRLTFSAEGQPAYVGSLAAASDDFEPFLAMVGLGFPVAAIDNSARIDGDIELDGATAKVTLRNSQVADRLVNGRLSLAQGSDEAWTVGGDLHIDAIDLGWITALGLGFALEPTDDPAAPWSRAPFGEVGYGEVSGRISVAADTLAIMRGFEATGAELTLDLQPSRLAVDVAHGQAVGGSIGGSLSVHNVGGNARVTGHVELEGATLEELVWSRGGRAVATGIVDLSAEFEAAGRSPAAVASSLTGSGAVAIRDGEVRYMNPQAARLVIRASDLGQEFTENELREAFTRQIDGGSFAFDDAEGAVAIAAGVVRVKSLAIDGDDMDASGDAVLDLAKLTLESDWTVTFEHGGDAVEGIVPQVGIIFRGPITAPERIIDVVQFGSYLNIRQEERLLELLSQAETDRLEAERLNREKRKLREDAERRARKAAEAEAARIAAEAEARQLAAEELARQATAEAERVAAEAERRRVAAEQAARDAVAAEAARDAAAEQAERSATDAERLRELAEEAAAKAQQEADALAAAEQAAHQAELAEAAAKAAAEDAVRIATKAEERRLAAERAADEASVAAAARRVAEEQAVSAAADADQRQREAEDAVAAAADEVTAKIAAEEEAHQSVVDAERRMEAAKSAAGEAADKLAALIEAEEAARAAADQAARLAAEAARRLADARQAAESAGAEVARLEAARQAATEEADRRLAAATEKLWAADQEPDTGSAPGGAIAEERADTGITEEEAARLRAEVGRAIQAADEVDAAFVEAQAAMAAAADEVARLETEAERSQSAATEASNRATEALAARNAAEEGWRTANANADEMTRAADEAVRLAEQAGEARQAAEADLERLRAEAARLAGAAEAAAENVADAEAARISAEDAIADARAEVERLQRAAEEAAETAADTTAAHEAAAVETTRLVAKAEQQAAAAEEAANAAEAAEARRKAGEEEAKRIAAEAKRLGLAAEEAARAAEEAEAALEEAEIEAARIAAKAEEQRLAAEEATRQAQEVSVPR